jgi:hypothetical protein
VAEGAVHEPGGADVVGFEPAEDAVDLQVEEPGCRDPLGAGAAPQA